MAENVKLWPAFLDLPPRMQEFVTPVYLAAFFTVLALAFWCSIVCLGIWFSDV